MAARAAARVALPIGNQAWTGMPANVHSGSRRTRAPLSSSRRHAQPLVEVTPNPAAAAAMAPSFSSVEKCGSSLIADSWPLRLNRQAAGTAAAVPPTMRWRARSSGVSRTPWRAR